MKRAAGMGIMHVEMTAYDSRLLCTVRIYRVEEAADGSSDSRLSRLHSARAHDGARSGNALPRDDQARPRQLLHGATRPRDEVRTTARHVRSPATPTRTRQTVAYIVSCPYLPVDFISARCPPIYISRLCYDVSVCLFVRLSVTEVDWRIIANWAHSMGP